VSPEFDSFRHNCEFPLHRAPTLFIVKANIAALFACIREYQKLINKYETIPIPSQPTNITKKLEPETNNNIKKVNNDKYEKNLWLCLKNQLQSCNLYYSIDLPLFILYLIARIKDNPSIVRCFPSFINFTTLHQSK